MIFFFLVAQLRVWPSRFSASSSYSRSIHDVYVFSKQHLKRSHLFLPVIAFNPALLYLLVKLQHHLGQITGLPFTCNFQDGGFPGGKASSCPV